MCSRGLIVWPLVLLVLGAVTSALLLSAGPTPHATAQTVSGVGGQTAQVGAMLATSVSPHHAKALRQLS